MAPRPTGAGGTAAPGEEAGPDGALIDRARALLAQYDRRGPVDEAVRLLRSNLLPSTPDEEARTAETHALLAKAYWLLFRSQEHERHWLDKAEPLLDRASELDPGLATPHLVRAAVATEKRQWPEAEAALARADSLGAPRAELALRHGQLHLARGRLEEAEGQIREAARQSPDSREINDTLGTVLFRQGTYAEAEAVFLRSLELDPRSVATRASLSAVLFHLGRLTDAARHLQDALQISADSALYSNLGSLLFFQGLYEQAADAYEKSLEVDRGAHLPIYWANLGDAYRQIPGREADARQTFRRAVQLMRQGMNEGEPDPNFRSRLALYLAKAGEAEPARDQLAALSRSATASNGAGAGPEPLADLPLGVLYRMALAREILGNREHSLDLLEGMLKRGFPQTVLEREPELGDLRADPAYHRRLAALAEQTQPPP